MYHSISWARRNSKSSCLKWEQIYNKVCDESQNKRPKKSLTTWVWGSEREALQKELRTEWKRLNWSLPDKGELGRGNKGIKF